MLTVSQGVMNSLACSAERDRKTRFLKWIHSLSETVGSISRNQAALAFDATLPEADRAEIDTEARLFDYVLARLLMPDMNGLQYVLAFDIVFSDLPPAERVRQLIQICEQYRG